MGGASGRALSSQGNSTFRRPMYKMLKALHQHPNEVDTSQIPKHHRTFLGTSKDDPLNDKIKSVSGHEYFYFGLRNQILFYLDKYQRDDIYRKLKVLKLIWGTDGFDVYKSNNTSSWPILGFIEGLFPRKVFEICVTFRVVRDMSYLRCYQKFVFYFEINVPCTQTIKLYDQLI